MHVVVVGIHIPKCLPGGGWARPYWSPTCCMGWFTVVLSEGVAHFFLSIHSSGRVTCPGVELSSCVGGLGVVPVSGWVADDLLYLGSDYLFFLS